MDDEMKPFRIEVPRSELEELKARLNATRWPNEIDEARWSQGVDLGYLRELARYWAEDYDWQRWEARLNAWPQFTTEILDQRIHVIHARSSEAGALPLILTHGWPGSVSEFSGLIGPLSDPVRYGGDAADAFHVVVPSLPGYGFSGATRQSGWNTHRVGEAWSVLMRRLGYQGYGAHGGDWGSVISRCLAAAAPSEVVGIHLTLFVISPPEGDRMGDLDRRESAAFAHVATLDQHRGYIGVQSTRPQTLGYALDDSPVGLLAWMVDKFWAWTDHDGNPESAISRDEILTNASIYWFTRTATSAARMYYETIGTGPSHEHTLPTPIGLAVFPKELTSYRRAWIEARHNLVHWTEFDAGGHFPALEAPDQLVGDLRSFFRPLRNRVHPKQ